MSEQLAKLYQATYARLAPSFGYQANSGRVVPWDKLPARDQRLLTAVADVVELHFYSGSADAEDELPGEFQTEAIYGHASQLPLVLFSLNGRRLAQITPENAMELGESLIACANASLTDAFLVDFMRERVGLEMEQAGSLLLEFRHWREQRDEKLAREDGA